MAPSISEVSLTLPTISLPLSPASVKALIMPLAALVERDVARSVVDADEILGSQRDQLLAEGEAGGELVLSDMGDGADLFVVG